MNLAFAPTLAVVPTTRAAVLAGLAAPVALVIAALAPGAWLVAPGFALAVLLLVLADALLAGAVLRHRLLLSPAAEIEGKEIEALVGDLIGRTEAPR